MAVCFSCSEDEQVSGCTDPAASNYDPSAAVNDGSCRLLRDDYLGTYNVDISGCDKDAFFSDLTMVVSADATKSTDVGIVVKNVYAKLLIFKGTVSTSGLVINSRFDSFVSRAEEAFNFNGNIYLFPTFVMVGTLTSENNSLNGPLALKVLDANTNNTPITSIKCQYALTKS
jgi:hypothetical protein